MESKSKIFGHPVHTILIVFPLGLLSTTAIFDVLALLSRDETTKQKRHETAQSLLGAGILGGLVAAPFGARDWLAVLEGTRAKRIGKLHGLSALSALGLFAASWKARRENPSQPPKSALAISFAGAEVLSLVGWLGGELVERLGVGVSEGAQLDASNSLLD